MKHILVALDFTACADRAFDRAVQLAAQHGAELTLAHVIDPISFANESETGSSLHAEALALANRKLHDYAARLALKVNFRVAIGDAARELATLVRESGAELAVLGAHGDKPFLDIFFRATAYYTIQQCAAPFLIVNERTQGPYRKVLALTDFSTCAKRAFHAAVTMGPEAEFHVLHVYETPFPSFVHFSDEELEEYRQERLSRIERDVDEEMRNFIAHDPDSRRPRVTPLLERNDVDAGIRTVVERLQPDLLAMGLSGRGFASLIGSRTIAYLSQPPCDMLVTI
jgi:nucleotide-binding universal stress UspA family protein